MHSSDARRLYVDVSDALNERAAVEDLRRRRGAGALVPRSGAQLSGTEHQRGGEAAREGAAVRLPRGGRLRAPGRGGARPLQPRSSVGGGVPERRRPPPAGAARFVVCRGRALGRLRLAGPEAGRHPLPAARPPATGRRAGARTRAGSRRSPTCAWATTSFTRTTGSPASPASRPRRVGGRHARLPGARVPRLGPRLRAHGPAVEDHPVRRDGGAPRRSCRRWAPSAGRASRRGLGARPASWRASS